MHVAALADEDDFEGWRDAARALAMAGVAPGDVSWRVGTAPGDLFGSGAAEALPRAGTPFSVPRAFLTLAELVICHAEPERFALLYTLLCRIRTNPKALEDSTDPLVQRLERMAKEVRRDMHKMHAFVRFREVEEEGGGTRFVAWFEPDGGLRGCAGRS
jgi:DNA polymerase